MFCVMNKMSQHVKYILACKKRQPNVNQYKYNVSRWRQIILVSEFLLSLIEQLYCYRSKKGVTIFL